MTCSKHDQQTPGQIQSNTGEKRAGGPRTRYLFAALMRIGLA